MVDAQVPDPRPLEAKEVLRLVLQHLGSAIRPEQLETWFRSLDVRRVDDREVEFTVTSQFVRDWLHRNYITALQEAVHSIGEPKRRVVVTHREEDGFDSLRHLANASRGGTTPDAARGNPQIAEEIERLIRQQDARQQDARQQDNRPSPPAPGLASYAAPNNPGAASTGSGPRSNPLNPAYTFDRFVVGSCNRLAHASAIAIGENPGCAYNPLFIHGNVGLGKSHLLQAICHTILRRNPGSRVVYLSCEDFTNAFISALQAQRLDAFRDYYRNADVLVLDDVQFFANREKTQDEFFHTFNTLYDGQKQIVLSSDRKPMDIPTIEERLVSRFKWGLVAEVEAPCFDTRKAIIRRKAEGRGVALPEDVTELLAERLTSNIRELEGAVIKVLGLAAIMEQPITRQLAENSLRGMPIVQSQVSTEDVMALVTTEFAITARELIGKGRTQTVSLPRQVAMYLLREHTECSLEEIGRLFGNRDHTTVLYAVTKIGERVKVDRMFKEHVDRLSTLLLTRSFRN